MRVSQSIRVKLLGQWHDQKRKAGRRGINDKITEARMAARYKHLRNFNHSGIRDKGEGEQRKSQPETHVKCHPHYKINGKMLQVMRDIGLWSQPRGNERQYGYADCQAKGGSSPEPGLIEPISHNYAVNLAQTGLGCLRQEFQARPDQCL